MDDHQKCGQCRKTQHKCQFIQIIKWMDYFTMEIKYHYKELLTCTSCRDIIKQKKLLRSRVRPAEIAEL